MMNYEETKLEMTESYVIKELPSLSSLVQDGGSDKSFGHNIRVTVRRRTAVFEIAFPIFRHLSWDADTGVSAGHTVRETLDAGRFMKTGESKRRMFNFFIN